ncbi:hypothetical protein TNCV_2831881 [Trichonephila clavipes]|nr:hypothetical protein TNCV_2831881 [Trichonephila clavipes]
METHNGGGNMQHQGVLEELVERRSDMPYYPKIRAHYKQISEFERGHIIGLKKAVLSDESCFQLCPDHHRRRVRRRPGQRADYSFTAAHRTGLQTRVMVWGVICFDSQTPLVVIRGNLQHIGFTAAAVTAPFADDNDAYLDPAISNTFLSKSTCAGIRIIFNKLDEAHFWLNGYVNKQNCRIWSEANPQVYVETQLHPEKLTVWCALWAGGILLQKR